jgi:hypothetical protein
MDNIVLWTYANASESTCRAGLGRRDSPLRDEFSQLIR